MDLRKNPTRDDETTMDEIARLEAEISWRDLAVLEAATGRTYTPEEIRAHVYAADAPPRTPFRRRRLAISAMHRLTGMVDLRARAMANPAWAEILARHTSAMLASAADDENQDRFCRDCGADEREADNPDGTYCPRCGATT